MAEHIHNWPEISTAYVTGSMTQKALADDYGISYELVRKHASAENWSQQRADFWTLVNKEIAGITATHAALQKRDFDQAASLAADLIVAKIADQVANVETTIEGFDKDGIVIKKSVAAKLASLSATLGQAIAAKYRLLDIPAPTIRVQDITPPPIAAIPDATIRRMVEEKVASGAFVPLQITPEDEPDNGEVE